MFIKFVNNNESDLIKFKNMFKRLYKNRNILNISLLLFFKFYNKYKTNIN